MTYPSSGYTSLDPDQIEAVESHADRIMLFGGPDSGKTLVLAESIASLEKRKKSFAGIVGIAFNHREAERMRGYLRRDAGLGVNDPKPMLIVTVHELAEDFLRSCGCRILGLPRDIELWDKRRSMRVLSEILQAMGRSPHNHIELLTLVAEAHRLGEGSQTNQQAILDSYPLFRDVIESYNQRATECQARNTHEAVALAIEAIKRDPKAAAEWGHDMVQDVFWDDFQHARKISYLFVTLLKPPQGSMTLALDPNQMVHEWNGASRNWMFNLINELPTPQVFHLDVNFRACDPIVNISNQILTSAGGRAFLGEMIQQPKPSAWPGPKWLLQPILIRVEGDLEDLDRYIARHIEEVSLLTYSYEDIACIARRRDTLERLAAMFNRAGIPCRIYSESSRNDESAAGVQGITLSTIHDALGQKWKQVWLVDVNDKIMPGPVPAAHMEWIDEELRRFYVAATRAREELIFCYSADRQSGLGVDPSRFFDGLKGTLSHFTVDCYEP